MPNYAAPALEVRMKQKSSYLVFAIALLAGCASTSGNGDDANAHDSEFLEVASSSCHVNSGETSVHVMLKVDQYRGIQHGHNGDHEIVEATVTSTLSVTNPSLVDTTNVEVAMNVRSSTDPAGLPNEIPIAVGDTFEVQGEYIPAATAHAHNANGPAAVIHFTHSPCGFAMIAGREYQ
jgi:hypothetical protein